MLSTIPLAEESLPDGWVWVDPAGRGVRRVTETGLELTPVAGAGVLRNVLTPRMVRPFEGDFDLETTLDLTEGRERAGGLLVYQDDRTLLRLMAGMHLDGEISLTVKSREHGLAVVGRGLLPVDEPRLRLARRGNCFTAWCGDGDSWYRCGRAEIPLDHRVEAGIVVETTQRHFCLNRCAVAPVEFSEIRLFSSA